MQGLVNSRQGLEVNPLVWRVALVYRLLWVEASGHPHQQSVDSHTKRVCLEDSEPKLQWLVVLDNQLQMPVLLPWGVLDSPHKQGALASPHKRGALDSQWEDSGELE